MKRIVALFMTALMVFFMLPQVTHAAPENVTLTVVAEKDTAFPGDTVHFSVAIGAVESLGVLEFTLNIPSGLTISDSSITIPEGLGTILDSDGEIIKPASINGYKWSYSAQSTGYKGTSDLTILTFACTVDSDSVLEAKNVTINVATCCDNVNIEEHNVNVIPTSVTVKKAPVPVTGVVLNKDTLTLKEGDEQNLIATVTPDNADNQKIEWTSSDLKVATVEEGKVKALKAGTAVITATTEDGNKTATCTVTVTCNHTLVKTEAKEPTCVDTGNIEYYTCSKCSKIFSDVEGKVEATTIEIAATGEHVEEIRNDVEPTEEAPGYTGDTYCSVCEQLLKKGSVIAQLPHTHHMTHVDAVEATCETAGNIEYYLCSKCGKKYSDEAGTNEVTDVSIVATGHKAGDEWNRDTDKHWKECEVCHSIFDKATHVYYWVVDKAATIDESGVKHEECECGVKRNENTSIPKLTHEHSDITHHDMISPTCTNTGVAEHWTCGHKYCAGKYYSDEQCQIEIKDVILAINLNNHIYDDDADAYCNGCNYQRFYEVISGINEVYVMNSNTSLKIRVDADYSLFDSVKVDGITVESSNYSVEEGSTIITFKNDYLNTLSAAVHEVEILYTDGKTAKAQFTINPQVIVDDSQPSGENNNDVFSPKTGESIAIIFVIAMIACAGCILFMKKKLVD